MGETAEMMGETGGTLVNVIGEQRIEEEKEGEGRGEVPLMNCRTKAITTVVDLQKVQSKGGDENGQS